MTIDIGNECVECRNDTSEGSGLFVNRIPASTDDLNGYLCTDCQLMECDMCGEMVVDYGGYDGMIVCDDCNPEDEEEDEKIWSDERLDALHQVNMADTKKKDEEEHEN